MVDKVMDFICILSCFIVAVSSQDLAHELNASGPKAVLLAVSRIQQSGLFANDKDLLIRIAYVETRDGTRPGTFRDGYNGGIWAVDEDVFVSTQDTAANTKLLAKIQQIQESFNINWLNVPWSELRKPFFSALAARLIIFNVPGSIPGDIRGQAQFWARHHNKNGDGSEFMSALLAITERKFLLQRSD